MNIEDILIGYQEKCRKAEETAKNRSDFSEIEKGILTGAVIRKLTTQTIQKLKQILPQRTQRNEIRTN